MDIIWYSLTNNPSIDDIKQKIDQKHYLMLIYMLHQVSLLPLNLNFKNIVGWKYKWCMGSATGLKLGEGGQNHYWTWKLAEV